MTGLLLLALAWAAPPMDPAQIAAAAPSAQALIARCAQEGRACGASRTALAEAFVVRAVNAAVARGEVDRVGAANARTLDPRVILGWEAVLPQASEPDRWVLEWIGPMRSDAPPAPARRVRDPLRLAHPDRSEVRIAMGLAGGQLLVGGMALQGRLAFTPGFSGLVEVAARRGVHRTLAPASWPQSPQFRAVVADDLVVKAAAGPRWSREAGAEIHPVVGLSIGRSTLNPVSQRAVEELGADPAPWTAAVGFGFGAAGAHPLVRQGRLALGWDTWVQASDAWSPGPANLSKKAENATVAAASPLRDLTVDGSLRYRPEETGPSLQIGGHLEWGGDEQPGVEPTRARGPWIAVGWTL